MDWISVISATIIKKSVFLKKTRTISQKNVSKQPVTFVSLNFFALLTLLSALLLRTSTSTCAIPLGSILESAVVYFICKWSYLTSALLKAHTKYAKYILTVRCRRYWHLIITSWNEFCSKKIQKWLKVDKLTQRPNTNWNQYMPIGSRPKLQLISDNFSVKVNK